MMDMKRIAGKVDKKELTFEVGLNGLLDDGVGERHENLNEGHLLGASSLHSVVKRRGQHGRQVHHAQEDYILKLAAQFTF